MFKEEKSTTKSYVMQGLESKKELSVYHLILAPTFDCNLRCKHCYLPDHNQDYLPKDLALKLVDDWSEIVLDRKGQYNGIFHIKGGEPFVLPYFWELVDKVVSKKSLQLMLTTNGTFNDKYTISKLVIANNELDRNLSVIVSLDGASEESNSKLRGKGHFKKALKFLDELQQKGINFYLNCVLFKGNFEEIKDYINIAREYKAT